MRILIFYFIFLTTTSVFSQGSKVVPNDEGSGEPTMPTTTTTTTTTNDEIEPGGVFTGEPAKLYEQEELTIIGMKLDDTPEAAARAHALRQRNARNNRNLSSGQMSAWTNAIQNTFRADQQLRDQERAAEKLKWERLQNYADRREWELTNIFKNEREQIKASEAFVNAIMNGYQLGSSSKSELEQLISKNSYGPKPDSPYHVHSLYTMYKGSPEDSKPEKIFMANILFEYGFRNYYKNLDWINETGASHFNIPSFEIESIDSRFRDNNESFHNIHFGTSPIVSMNMDDFLKFMTYSYDFKAGPSSHYSTSRPSQVFQSLNNKEQLDYHLIATSNKKELEELIGLLGKIIPSKSKKITVDAPVSDFNTLTNAVSKRNNRSKDMTQKGEELNDYRDAKKYKTVWIGDQLWMAENLNIETGHYYKNRFVFYSASTAAKACPPGWKLPNYADVIEMLEYVKETFQYSKSEIKNKEYISELFNNFGFRYTPTNSYRLNFKKWRGKEKLSKWFQKKWTNAEPTSKPDADGEQQLFLDKGFYFEIPEKFITKYTYNKSYGPQFWQTYNTMFRDTDNPMMFWISNVTYKEDAPTKVWGIGFRKTKSVEEWFTESRDNLDMMLPCRCIKEFKE